MKPWISAVSALACCVVVLGCDDPSNGSSAGGSFSVDAMTMTEMAGEPAAMQAENLYHSLLAQARRWRLDDMQLVLSDGSQDLLIFDPR